jgi:mono/diheme cytochrome c family protein
MKGSFAFVIIAVAAVGFSRPACAQGSDATTTARKVFSAEQAAKGKQVYLLTCVSCHSPADHTGGKFWGDLLGKPVSEFFSYLKSSMPQNDPGSLPDDDYASAIAYLLQLNGMPPGDTPLPGDSTALAKIRFATADTTKKGPTR